MAKRKQETNVLRIDDKPISEIQPGHNGNGRDSGTSGGDSATVNGGSGSEGNLFSELGGQPDIGLAEVPIGSQGDGDADGSELPIETVRTLRQNDPTRNGGSGNGRGRGNRGGAAGGSRKRATETESAERLANEGVLGRPREVEESELSSLKKGKSSAISETFLSEMWQLVFHATGSVVKDTEVWDIEDDEAADLAKRTSKLLASLDSKRYQKLTKMVGKYEPTISLAVGLFAIAAPRIQATRAKKHVIVPKKQNENGNPPVAIVEPSSPAGENGSSANGRTTAGAPIVGPRLDLTSGNSRAVRGTGSFDILGLDA